MMRQFVLSVALLAAWYPWGRLAAAPRTDIIPQTTAARHGLTRRWFTQVQMDRSRARVKHLVLHEGTLYVQSNRAMVHAIDAETGETLWARRMGRPNHPSLTPAADRDLLAILNGSRLYVCNRYNGDLLYEVQVDGVPGAGPCLSRLRVYVPMADGMLVAYRLEALTDPLKELGKVKKDPTPEEIAADEEYRRENLRLKQEAIRPLLCQSLGRALVQPLVTRETEAEEYVAWPTDRGYLHIGRIDVRSEDRLALRFRLETGAEISARPTYLPPDPSDPTDSGIIFAPSRDGYVHAVRERTGESMWRFSTGEPILQPAVVINERVYVANQLGGMFCLGARDGAQIWWTPRIRQFVAASKQRVYAVDSFGRILALSAETGARLDTIAAEHLPIKLINSDTDRMYLASDSGLIQCLHEQELSEAIRHGEALKKKAEEEQPAIQQRAIDELEPPDGPGVPEQEQPGAEDSPFG
ncbi:MAG: outer membrane protein assembly factor BamB family protein [Planctomycetota bacterium]|jgi:hypothetical protein